MTAVNWRDRQSAQHQGAVAAVREWMRLGLDPDQSFDIMRVIADSPITLMFRPLNRAYGFFTRLESRLEYRAQIVIHSSHPLSLQRFTAAHEYGHFVLGHSLSMDSEQEIFGRAVALQELAAQAFAADFLTPLPVVNRALDRLALAQGQHPWTAEEAYQLSLELGVSYRATLTQLSALHLIGDRRLGELRKIRPADIKKALNGGVALPNSRADLWLVDERTQRRWLRLQVEDELCLRVPTLPLGALRWVGERVRSDETLQPIADDLVDGVQSSLGLSNPPADHQVRWRSHGVGSGTLRVGRADPSAPEGFRIKVEVIDRGNGPGQHVLQRQHALVRAAREYRAALGIGQDSLGQEP